MKHGEVREEWRFYSMCDGRVGTKKIGVIGLDNLSSGGRMPECVYEFCYLL